MHLSRPLPLRIGPARISNPIIRPLLSSPMSTDIIGQRNTRRLAMDFLVKLKSPSLFLSPPLFPALHHIVFRFFRFHPGYSVRCKNDSPPTIAHTGGFLNILNIMSPCLPIYQKLLRPAGSLLRALSEGPPHLANLKHSLPGSRLLIDKGRSDAKNVLKLGSLILSLWSTTLCVKGRSAPGEVNLSLSDGDYYRVIIRRFCAAL